jgi:hypothetical protein
MKRQGAAKNGRARGSCLDAESRRRREVLAQMASMSSKALLQTMVEAGIYTPDHRLTPEYGGLPRRG